VWAAGQLHEQQGCRALRHDFLLFFVVGVVVVAHVVLLGNVLARATLATPGDLDVVGPRHFYGFRLFLVGDGDVGQLGEVRVGVDEAGRLAGFQEADLVDFTQHRVALVDPQEDVRGVGVVSDDPGLHLPLVVGDEDHLAGGETHGADRLKALADEVGLGELDDPPGLLELDHVSVLHGGVLEGPHGLDQGRLVEAVAGDGRRGGDDARPNDGPLGQPLAGRHANYCQREDT